MAGFDKYILGEKLEKLGWYEVKNHPDGNYMWSPPDALFENSPSAFYVYHAETLQELLGMAIPDDE